MAKSGFRITLNGLGKRLIFSLERFGAVFLVGFVADFSRLGLVVSLITRMVVLSFAIFTSLYLKSLLRQTVKRIIAYYLSTVKVDR